MRSPVIRAESLRRTYSVPVRREGVIGSLANLFVRRYRFVEALQDVSFEIHAGEVVGLIGPNGAGKSTTIKILTGILTPSSGIVQLLGYTPHLHRQVITRRIGAMFGQRTQLWWDLTPMDGFQMLRHIYDIPQAAFSRMLNDLSDALGLEAFIEQPVRKLSLGQRVRADVAAALLHEPAVVFLDEPMIGLDVLVKERVRALIARLSREKGVTVLLTTHDLMDVEAVCSRAIIINQGRITFDGSLDQLKATLGGFQTLICTIKSGEDVKALLESMGSLAHATYCYDTRELRVSFDPQAIAAPTVISYVMGRVAVEQLALTEPQMDALIKPFYAEAPP